MGWIVLFTIYLFVSSLESSLYNQYYNKMELVMLLLLFSFYLKICMKHKQNRVRRERFRQIRQQRRWQCLV